MKVITISNAGQLQKATNSLKYLRTQQPKMSENIMRQFGKELVENMKNSALKSGITPFTSNRFDGIRWEQERNRAALYIPEHMVYLDSLKRNPTPVRVDINKPQLLRWALTKGRGAVRSQATRVQGGLQEYFFIGVRRKPFMNKGWEMSRRKLPKMIRRESARVLKNV